MKSITNSRIIKIIRYAYYYFDNYILVAFGLIISVSYFIFCIVIKENNSAITEFGNFVNMETTRNVIDEKRSNMSSKKTFFNELVDINQAIKNNEYAKARDLISKFQKQIKNKSLLYEALELRKDMLKIYDTPYRDIFYKEIEQKYKDSRAVADLLLALHLKYHK